MDFSQINELYIVSIINGNILGIFRSYENAKPFFESAKSSYGEGAVKITKVASDM